MSWLYSFHSIWKLLNRFIHTKYIKLNTIYHQFEYTHNQNNFKIRSLTHNESPWKKYNNSTPKLQTKIHFIFKHYFTSKAMTYPNFHSHCSHRWDAFSSLQPETNNLKCKKKVYHIISWICIHKKCRTTKFSIFNSNPEATVHQPSLVINFYCTFGAIHVDVLYIYMYLWKNIVSVVVYINYSKKPLILFFICIKRVK